MPLTNLKPVLYRMGNEAKVRSGWINPVTSDISDTEANNLQSVAIVPHARAAFTVGQRVEFASLVDLYPYDCIRATERACVAAVDAETGEVQLLLEGIHDGLEGNMLSVVPFEAEETIAALRLFEKPSAALAKSPRAERAPSLLWAGVAFVAVMPIGAAATVFADAHAAAVLFGCAVCFVAAVMGAPHALLLGALLALGRNLFLVPPVWRFNAPTPDEYFRAAVWLALALIVPWLCTNSGRIRKALRRTERVLEPRMKEE